MKGVASVNALNVATQAHFELSCILWGGGRNSIQLPARVVDGVAAAAVVVVLDDFLGSGAVQQPPHPTPNPTLLINESRQSADFCLHCPMALRAQAPFLPASSSLPVIESILEVGEISYFVFRLWRQMRATRATHLAVGQ